MMSACPRGSTPGLQGGCKMHGAKLTTSPGVGSFCETNSPGCLSQQIVYDIPVVAIHDSTMLQIPLPQFVDPETISLIFFYPGAKTHSIAFHSPTYLPGTRPRGR